LFKNLQLSQRKKANIVEGRNVGELKAKGVRARVVEVGITGFSISYHTYLWKLFDLRPGKNLIDRELRHITIY